MICLWKKILCAVFVLCSLSLLGTAVAAAADRPVHTAGPIEPLGSMYDHNTAEEASAKPLGSGPSSGNANEETSVGPITLGLGKGENMVSVIDQVFGKDLSGYDYVSFAELWRNDDAAIPQELFPFRKLLTDLFVETDAGEGLPLGFLYRGTEAYTVIRQADNTLRLTSYEILSTEATQPDYRTATTEVRPAAQSVVRALYQ